MITANVPILKAMRIIVEQTKNPRLRSILVDIGDSIDGGSKLSDAVEKHVNVFGFFYVNMIRSGELSGKFDEILTYLADQQEKDYDLRSKIKGALAYPIFILSAITIMGIGMMMFVVPKLTQVFKESNIKLPLTTRMLISASDFMKERWYLVIGVIVLAVIGFPLLIKTNRGRIIWDNILLRLPKFGEAMVQKIYIVRFTQSMATLLVGGVTMPKALQITSDIIGNRAYKKVIDETLKEVVDGNPMADTLIKYPIIPNMLAQMISIGEETGRVDTVLEKMTAFYSKELDNTIASIMTLIEPIIMLIMGGAVAFLVLSIMLPMFKLSEAS
jgi:type IV pilus assembly protein PilC